MVEFYYWREGSGGKSRLETVVLLVPAVWSAQPSRIEWTSVQERYKAAYEAAVKKLEGDREVPAVPAEPAPDAGESATEATPAPSEKSQIVCSQFCFVKFPAPCAYTKSPRSSDVDPPRG